MKVALSDIKYHEYSNFFPLMEGEELAALVTDIKEHGLLEPIVTLNGEILDGRNRYRACQEAAVSPTFTEYRGNEPLSYVISKNINRRHLNPSQLAVLALEIEPELAKEAAKRVAAGRIRGGETEAAKARGEGLVGTYSHQPKRPSRDEAGKAVGVSGKQVTQAKRIKKEMPERLKDIKAGKATVGGVYKELRQKKARESVEGQMAKTAAKKRQEEPREVGQFMDALKAWRKAVNEAIEVAKFGKFSPEAKAFVLKWLDDQEQKLAELREAFNA